MNKMAYGLIVTGIIIVLAYIVYQLLIATMPLILKIAIIFILTGISLLIFKLLKDRKTEVKEQEKYKDL
ncbi:hypothetical protein EZV73_16340 [Acidaminobacter sp. JC074]|uniref:hypothetical protein n=1 Tax=Acidaminobacter sp. JC074 TaxID=2530199 RepID=UPI001F0FF8F6|nr:hypothetical protein [Acidaminobacter sp. JC074]MCH4889166.1 hypothetical protein [Acidaminobacter sp. JC074]